jgi:PadR family transcriptional regulator AphA
MAFNTVTYSVMGILLRAPRTGYDVVKELKSFRPAKSSQIYPVLSKLEKQGLATVQVMHQSGRPDKKIYQLTDLGKSHLLEWLDTHPEPPVIRDDFLSMLFSAWAKDVSTVTRLLTDRRRMLDKHAEDLNAKYAQLLQTFPTKIKDPASTQLSAYLLVGRRLRLLEEEGKWCEEMLTQIASWQN